jgi:multiple sugar transport system ATP-binding protein
MNVVEASVQEGEARFGTCAIPLPEGSALRAGAGRPIVLGVRPHDLQLGGAPAIPGRVLVVERLGTETHLVVGIDAPRLRTRALADAIDASPDDDVLLAEDDRASFTVVAEARVAAEVGDRVELGLNPARLQGFDAETGEALNASATERSAVAA